MSGTAVIIPFYQRKAGLLVAAIRSVLAQVDINQGVEPITILVCDDASPISADTELDALDLEERKHVVLLKQTNSGPGPARNSALAAVPPGTEWIAFLDSDDRWGIAHLTRAIAALREGYDLCFADALREPDTLTHFQGAQFKLEEHDPISAHPGLFRFNGNFLTLNITLSPVSISTVVMRAATLGDLRFPTMTFEDLMYWFEAARRSPRIAFDGTLQVHYGRGDITVTDSFASRQEAKNTLSYHRIFSRVLREFTLTRQQRVILKERMARNRHRFSKINVSLIRNGVVPDWRVLARFLRLDPRVIGSVIEVILSRIVKRLLIGRDVTINVSRTG